MEAHEIAAIIASLGNVELRDDGLHLVTPKREICRLDTPVTRRLVLEALYRPMPTPVVGHALELLLDDAVDVRSPPPPEHVETD